jgi:hypothetical protein
MNNFVVRCFGDHNLLWSNDEGWTESDNFEVYTLEESEESELPFGGEWIRLQTL